MKAQSILVYCQYLLGIGHVQRSATVVKALCARGFAVHVALGGTAVEQISFGDAKLHYLTPVRTADSGFSALVHADGRLFSDSDKIERAAALLALAQAIKPDVLVVETYPFGRRAMRFELKPLLQWASEQSPRPFIVGSVRDILQRLKPDRERESLSLVKRYFDKIWVHGDPSIVKLESSFPSASEIAHQLSYTGYVAPAKPAPSTHKSGLLISAGGGATGRELMRTALQLFNSGHAADKHWTFATGPKLDPETFSALQSVQNPRFTLHKFLPQLCEHMSRSELSISMAGYNTSMDVLQSGVAAVMVPFIGELETEQLQRTKLLEAKHRITCVPEDQLSVNTLARAIEQARSLPLDNFDIDMNGAENAATQLSTWLKQRKV